MFSAGLAAQRMNWLKDCKAVFAIPVSASSKNPFFDRKTKEERNKCIAEPEVEKCKAEL